MKNLPRILVLLFAWLAIGALAQSYPSKPIRLIIPFPPGGSSDIVGREFAHHLGRALGHQFVIDNRAGANGLIGTTALAKAVPDGYSLMFHIITSHITNPWVYKKLPYDVVRDFASITLVGSSGLVFVANPSFPAQNMQDLISLAKANPGAIDIASFGTASMGHLSIKLLASMAYVSVTHVPYNGSGPAVVATLSGHVPVSVVALPAALPYINRGWLRPLALTMAERSKQLLNVPAVAETPGLAGYDAVVMYGLLAPAHTPLVAIKQVQETTVVVLRSPKVQRRLHERGIDQVIGSTPEEMDTYIRIEMERIGKLVKATDVTPR